MVLIYMSEQWLHCKRQVQLLWSVTVLESIREQSAWKGKKDSINQWPCIPQEFTTQRDSVLTETQKLVGNHATAWAKQSLKRETENFPRKSGSLAHVHARKTSASCMRSAWTRPEVRTLVSSVRLAPKAMCAACLIFIEAPFSLACMPEAVCSMEFAHDVQKVHAEKINTHCCWDWKELRIVCSR